MEYKLTAIILQARLDSKRLSGKALLPLDGKPIIFRVMEALNNVPVDLRLLACPDDSFTVLSPIAAEAGFKIHAGPKEDVLERYCQAIRRFGIKRVIRATGDNPFVFADAAIAVNKEAIKHNADYAGYLELPIGAGVESVSATALLRAASLAVTSYDREHVCPFLYNHPEIFNVYRPIAPKIWQAPGLRLTVDTQEDYEFAVKLYDALKDKHDGETIISHTNQAVRQDCQRHNV